MDFKSIFFVFTFGGLGSLARFFISKINPTSLTTIPWGTFAANFIACLIAGFVAGYFASRPFVKPELKFALLTGFCGGFSTFSTFSLETVQLFQNGFALQAAAYVTLSLAGCICGILAGLSFSKLFS